MRAIATDPELLLLDEITSALDPVLVGEVLDLVRDLKDNGSTILMATHEMGFARRVADRVVFLADGRVVEAGTARAALRRARSVRRRATSSPGSTTDPSSSNRVSCSPPGPSSLELTEPHGVRVGGAIKVAPASVSSWVAASASTTSNATRSLGLTRGRPRRGR